MNKPARIDAEILRYSNPDGDVTDGRAIVAGPSQQDKGEPYLLKPQLAALQTLYRVRDE